MKTTLSVYRKQYSDRLSGYAEAAALTVKQPMEMASVVGSGSSVPSMFGSSQARQQRQNYRDASDGWASVAVNAIAKRGSAQPFMVGKFGKQKRTVAGRKLPEWIEAKSHRMNVNVEIEQDHPLAKMFDRPNKVQGRWEFLFTTIANLLISGEFYWVGGIDDSGDEPKLELWSVPSSWVEDRHEGGLFTGYSLKLPGSFEGIPLEPEQVIRGYMPDPANPLKGSQSTVGTQSKAIRIDQKIQTSQDAAFDNGIFPHMAVSVGQTIGPDGKPTGQRPVLTGAQRRQIAGAVRRVMGRVTNSGEVAILDGLIENIFRIDSKNAEMDWLNSGKQVKERIFQAFQLNPLNVGEAIASTRAAAAVADRHFCDVVVNPLLNLIGSAGNSWANIVFPDDGLIVWVEPCEPTDEELQLRQWQVGLQNGEVEKGEYRTHVLGLPPLEAAQSGRTPLADLVGGITGAVQLLTSLGRQEIDEATAQRALVFFLGSDAAGIVDGASPPPTPAIPPPKPDDEPDDETLDSPEMDQESRAAVVHLLDMVGRERVEAWSK